MLSTLLPKMTPDRQHGIDDLDQIARLLDAKFRLPGTGLRFGWDTVLGLVPGLGDVATLIPAGYLLHKGYSLGARKRSIARMALNSGLDATLGAVPLFGDVFDLFFKSNVRNVALLRRELELKNRSGRLWEGGNGD